MTCPQAKQQDPQQHVFAVNTVRDNKKHITNNDYLRAVRARELQVMIRCRNIKFGTMEAVTDQKEAMLLKCIKGVVTLYRKAGFRVTIALMDGEFVPLCGGLAELGLRLNETSRDEHVGDIEWYIRTVKERMRAIYNTLPFHKIPARLVVEMAKTAVFWLNAFPAAGGA